MKRNTQPINCAKKFRSKLRRCRRSQSSPFLCADVEKGFVTDSPTDFTALSKFPRECSLDLSIATVNNSMPSLNCFEQFTGFPRLNKSPQFTVEVMVSLSSLDYFNAFEFLPLVSIPNWFDQSEGERILTCSCGFTIQNERIVSSMSRISVVVLIPMNDQSEKDDDIMAVCDDGPKFSVLGHKRKLMGDDRVRGTYANNYTVSVAAEFNFENFFSRLSLSQLPISSPAMPKHYRPAGKKKEGNAAKYITRSQSVKHLQVSLPVFRRLCILKGIFPREPKKKVKGNHHTYYHTKDILFLKHEPLLEKLRDMRAYDKKVKKAVSKKNKDLAERLLTRKPTYSLDRLIRERYPGFVDALRDLDDCLTMVHLFAALPATEREKVEVKRIHNCRRLSHEWQAYVSRTHKLRKTFISVKGIYYQAEVEGQKVTWLTPHALQQVVPPDVDYNIMLTFLEFYETLLAFVNFRLYHSINATYPPILDPRLEALAADLYALSRLLDANHKAPVPESTAVSTSGSGQTEAKQETDESELRLAQLQHQLPTNEAGALMHLVEEASTVDEDDEETKECKNLFKNMKFFLSREVPRESLLFVIPAFGGVVSWDGEGAPFNESDEIITHQIVDRPSQGRRFLSRDYIQPQWIYDCINSRIRLPVEEYLVGRVPPPHLSPFVDHEEEGYIPEYAETIRRLQAAARKEVLPMPGVGKEDLDDPQNLLVEGIINRAEAIEAAEKQKKMLAREKQFHKELYEEVQGVPSSKSDDKKKSEEEEEEDEPERVLRQIAKDNESLSETMMPRNKKRLYEAMKIGQERKKAKVETLKTRKKKLQGEKKSSE